MKVAGKNRDVLYTAPRGEGRKYLPKKFSEEVFCENYLEHKREKGAKVNEVILFSLEASRKASVLLLPQDLDT